MKIRIDAIKADGLEVSADTTSDPWWSETVHAAFGKLWWGETPAHVDIQLSLSEDTVSLGADVEAQLRPTCDRCLEPFDKPFQLQVHHYLIPAASPNKQERKGGEVELTAEDVEFGTYSNRELNLSEILREQLLLALPYQFLCRANCRGLCPHCGINLNQGRCHCHEEHNPSPFAVLKSLKM